MLTRRNFLQAGATLLTGTALRPQLALGADESSGSRLTVPTPAQLAWQDYEVGVIFHLDLPLVAGDVTGNNATRKIFDPNLYQPRQLDTDQWVAAAKAAGARYALFTATHFNGFMQWQSDLYPYGLKQTSWRGGRADIVGDFVTSCRKAGIQPGLYFSVHRNVYHQLWDHYVDWGKGRGTPAQDAFNRIAEKQMEELCSRHGPLAQIWLDAGAKSPAEGGPDLLPVFDRHQPNSVFYHSPQRSEHRWIGNEKGFADYPCWSTMPGPLGAVSHNSPAWKKILGRGDPDGAIWSPGMVDVPLRGANKVHSWFWTPNQEHGIEPTERLVQMHRESVGRNCNFVLGAVVTPEGLVPEPDVRRLADFGREVERRWGRARAATTGRGSRLELALPQPSSIASAILMEDIVHGERIQDYVVSGRLRDGEWRDLARGQSVGHKRLAEFSAVEVTALRLTIPRSKAEPHLRRFAAHAPV